MKILILNYEYPPLGGGAGVVSKYHAEGLAQKGHAITVITTWFEGEKEFEEKENLYIIRLKAKRRKVFKSTPDEWISWIYHSKKFLKKYLKTYKFEYCFAHFALPGGEVAKFIHKKYNIPYAIISHGQDIPWFFPKQMFKFHIFTYFWVKKVCKNAEYLVLLTRDMKKNADRFMGQQSFKNIVIPNGCDTKLFCSGNINKYKIFSILFVGRLVTQKDPLTFLRAINQIDKKLQFKAIILGDGPLKNKMQQFVKKTNLEDKVFFKGWVDKQSIVHHYQSANILVSTSLDEAMSIAALEALSTGIYMISTPVSGNTDIIVKGENGDFIGFKNSKQLAIKLEDYIKNPKKCVINNAFLYKFREKYDWENIIYELTKLLPKH